MSARENRWMVRRLLAAYRNWCRESGDLRQAGRKRQREESASPAEGSPLDFFERSSIELAERAAVLTREREAVPSLFSRLASRPPEKRKAAIRQNRAYRSWCFCERLIDECHHLLYSDIRGAEEMADLALGLAAELDPAYYGTGLVNDLKARAWAATGEVRRAGSDLARAENAFTVAEDLVEQGSGDALEEAQILEGKATLRRDQRRMPEALRLLGEAIEIYRQYNDFHRVGRAFVQKGQVYGALGDLERGSHCLRKGIALLDPLREPRVELAARHSLMLQLFERGRHHEAWFLLKAARPGFLAHGGVLLTLQLRWLEGRIQHALGREEEAEAALLEARSGFIVQGIGFDAALVSLDLAGLYAGQGRAAEMRRLAEEMLPIFQARDLHREAIAALILFQQAVRRETVTSELLQEIGAYLERARHDRELRFEPERALK
jgi:tetratricopeptide (TPR) repeat protein